MAMRSIREDLPSKISREIGPQSLVPADYRYIAMRSDEEGDGQRRAS